MLPPFRDLDGLPYYDYDLEDQHLLDGTLVPLTMERLKPRLLGYPNRTPTLYYMASRGCPHNCSYCHNCRYHAMWGSSPLRLIGVDRALDEIEYQIAAVRVHRVRRLLGRRLLPALAGPVRALRVASTSGESACRSASW